MEADFKRAVRDHYAKAINMVKSCKEAYASRDHYKAKGLKQNALFKQMLATIKELERQLQAAEEGLLNHKELYEIVADEALEVVKAQNAIEKFSKKMEEELHPLRMQVREAEAAI